MTTTETDSLQHEVERFLFREARLMDSNDYAGWLQLWADEGTYWLPVNDDDSNPHEHISLIYDNRQQLENRVWRLSGLHAHAQRPKSRLTRVVSNIEIEPDGGPDLIVHSAFVLCEVRKDTTHFWAGRNLHVLERGHGFLIKHKKVMLGNNDTVMPNVTFIV